MASYQLKTALSYDSTLPRDVICLNPSFNVTGVIQDIDQLCRDWLAAICTWANFTGPATCYAYEHGKPKPNPPAGRATQNLTATPPVSPAVRELALCLSFYAGANTPRKRGRLYIPAFWAGSTFAVRPSTAQRTTVGSIVTPLQALGGLNVDWGVWSSRDSAFRTVTNWYVDDEWDVQRRRGLRSTARTTGTSTGRLSGVVGDQVAELDPRALEVQEGATEPPQEDPQG